MAVLRKWTKESEVDEACDIMLKFHQTCTDPGCMLYCSWIKTPEGKRHVLVEERDGHTAHLCFYEIARIDVLEDFYGLVRMPQDSEGP